MTESEWRRSHADPGDLRRAAGELRRRAERMFQPFDRLRGEIGRARWAGQAAQRFRREIDERHEEMRHARRALDAAADWLEENARRLQADLDRVRREEQARRVKR